MYVYSDDSNFSETLTCYVFVSFANSKKAFVSVENISTVFNCLLNHNLLQGPLDQSAYYKMISMYD